MEWRCEWCGKPHEANDPPCDNCGHGQFERAVRPVAPAGEGGPTVWVCTNCGRDHPRNNPPCSRCGGMDLERREQSYEEGDPIGPGADVGGDEDAEGEGDESDPIGGDTMSVWACTECGRAHPRNNPPCSRCGAMTLEQRVRSFEDADDFDGSTAPGNAGGNVEDDTSSGAPVQQGPAGGSTEVWACTECGRSHPRNNPPCSRCGNMQFVRRKQEFDDLGPGDAGWLDALEAKVVLGFLGALVLLALVVGSALGIITLPGATPSTIPADEVPGRAESAHGLDLGAVESAYVDELNDRRGSAGVATLESSGALAERATWYNRRAVQAVYTDASPPSQSELNDAFPSTDQCSDSVVYAPYRVPNGQLSEGDLSQYDAEAAVAAALVDRYVERYGEFTTVSDGLVGVDVHVGPDDTVFVTQVVC